MDKSRLADLARMQAVIDNPFKPRYARHGAQKAKQAIVKQLKDKKLVRQRRRMVEAARLGDIENEWKIANQIKDYLKEERIED